MAGLQNESQDSQSYTGKHCLRKPRREGVGNRALGLDLGTGQESLDSLGTQIQSLSAKFHSTNVCWGGVNRYLMLGAAWMNF